MRHLILFLIAMLVAAPAAAAPAPARGGAILIYSGTTGFRHDSIPAGIKAVSGMAARRGLQVVASEDPQVFSASSLKRFRAIVLLSCTTDPKNPASEWLVGDRRTALQQFVRQGGGIVAIHAAADSHYNWPWYTRLIGAHFARHPAGTPKGTVTVVAPSDPAVRGLTRSIQRTDEWYYFDDYDPISKVLVTLDPATIGEKDTNPNPMAWTRQINEGRVFYTAMGHTVESYSDPWFLQLVGNGLDWVLKRR
ncbi:ThuA domain-containing protein [Sphingomonas sp. SM33]|uniref:ThuA domain-containing protein n=1 Tax=Sphingomonas telluris TaxID=2907998 RepID=A0ABS9VIW8_9SPHN|nr:ThuA domain-containing protein [Sphingomonas telluris]MCH8614917.1 ThuA domain-containing protein [Sphingomonas telluris]